jgi:hypothetical protein
MKVRTEYIQRLATAYGHTFEYTKKVIERSPKPREHHVILEKPEHLTVEEMIDLARGFYSRSEFMKIHSKYYHKLKRLNRWREASAIIKKNYDKRKLHKETS